MLELLRRGKHVVTANKQLVARRGAELFAAASGAGVQLRFEASVCAAIPVIKVLRESLVVTNVHRVLGIVNGTTNFMLTEMEGGKTYDEALARGAGARLRRGRPDRRRLRRRRGGEDGDPRDGRVQLARSSSPTSSTSGSTTIDAARRRRGARARHGDPPRRRGAPRRRPGRRARQPGASSTATIRSPTVEGAFNAVMLQGDAIREITLEGPGAGGVETASAVIADMASVIGTMGTGFLQNDAASGAACRGSPRGENRSPFYFHLTVDDRPGVLARVADALAEREVSVARLLQHQNGDGAALHVVTHEARQGALDDALAAIAAMDEVRAQPLPFPVVSDRGVAELGWA